MSAVGTQIINQLLPSENGSNALSDVMLRPLAEIAGAYLAEKFRQGITPGEKDNIASHVESVRQAGGVNVAIETSRKAENTAEWASAAADVNERENPELASAWRAVLEGILQDNDYDMIKVVGKMNQVDVNAIVKILDSSAIGRDFYDSDVGERLKNLGIARQSLLESKFTQKCVSITAMFVIIEILVYLTYLISYIDNIQPTGLVHFMELYSRTIVLVIMMMGLISYLFLFFVSVRKFKKFKVYVLTEYGKKLAQRIQKYLRAI